MEWRVNYMEKDGWRDCAARRPSATEALKALRELQAEEADIDSVFPPWGVVPISVEELIRHAEEESKPGAGENSRS